MIERSWTAKSSKRSNLLQWKALFRMHAFTLGCGRSIFLKSGTKTPGIAGPLHTIVTCQGLGSVFSLLTNEYLKTIIRLSLQSRMLVIRIYKAGVNKWRQQIEKLKWRSIWINFSDTMLTFQRKYGPRMMARSSEWIPLVYNRLPRPLLAAEYLFQLRNVSQKQAVELRASNQRTWNTNVAAVFLKAEFLSLFYLRWIRSKRQRQDAKK